MFGFLLSADKFGFAELLKNFFTHKDFLPSADKIPGTMFTPLHFVFAAIMAVIVIVGILVVRKLPEEKIKVVFAVLWATLTIAEMAKLIWETLCGQTVAFNWVGNLPVYPCSIWMYAMPFIIWGKGRVRNAACGYVCTLGLLGGLINFVYPATILGEYSAISFPGFQTFFYHGALVFCAFVLMTSGYHRIDHAESIFDCFLSVLPAYAMSIFANTANLILGTDYMFFRCNSFFLAPIGAAMPDALTFPITYALYAVICCTPYIVAYYLKRRKSRAI